MDKISVHHHHLIPGSPLVFGPGAWWLIHLKAYLTDTVEKIPEFKRFLHIVVSNIPCKTCRRNAINYIENNDGSRYMNKMYNGRFVGVFVWMVAFHNDVNRRNGENIRTWTHVLNAYSSPNPEHHHHTIPGDPEVFGPGAWWILHLTAYASKSNIQIKEFMVFVREMSKHVPCPTCRGHATEYVSENTGSAYITKMYDNRNIGMFIWISDFHNYVNKRNEKRSVPWKEGYSIYKHAYNEHNFENNISKIIDNYTIKIEATER